MKKTMFVCAILTFLATAAEGQGPPDPVVNPNMVYYTVADQSTFATNSLNWASVARVGTEEHVVFYGLPTQGAQGIWLAKPAISTPTLTAVATAGSSISGSCGVIQNFGATIPAHINSNGHIAFFATMFGGTCSGSLASIIVRTTGSPFLAVQKGMTPSGASSPLAEFNAVFGLSGSSGEVAFRGVLEPGPHPTGIWATSAGTIPKIAVMGDPAPGTGGQLYQLFGGTTGGSWSQLEPQYNSTLRSGFRATTSGSLTGVWTGVSGATQEFIALQGHQSPGNGGVFVDFGDVAINSSGIVAFRGCLVNCDSASGVWKGATNAQLFLVSRTNLAAPDKTGGFTIGNFGTFFDDPLINWPFAGFMQLSSRT